MTGLNTAEKRIGGALYKVHQIPYSDAKPLLWLGASVVLPAIQSLEGLDVGKLLAGELAPGDVQIDAGIVGKAFRIFFDRASKDDFDRVESLFTARTQVKVDGGKWIPLAKVAELHWPQAGYGALGQWLAFSVQVHFGPFSSAPGGGAAESPEGEEDA